MIGGFAPPEVITGRLMSGAGAGPMLSAAAGLASAAAGYEAAIDRYTAHLGVLESNMQGATGAAIAASLVKRIVFLRARQAQLVSHSGLIADQAAAFATAYAAMVQMGEIVQNRVTHDTAVATNFLGMTTPIINAMETQYGEMGVQNFTVQNSYFAATLANTTFKPFAPGPPMVTGGFSVPQLHAQAVGAAAGAADTVRLAAGTAQSTVSLVSMRTGQAAGITASGAARGASIPKQAQAQEAVARLRDNQRRSAEQLTSRFGEQLFTQGSAQAAQVAGQLGQLGQAPQQGFSQVASQGQQVFSQMASLMSGIKPDHQLGSPGFFDTQPDSPNLDRLAGSTPAASAMGAAVRVGSLSGLSGAATGFRFPPSWSAPISATPTGAAPPGGAPVRPTSGPMMMPRHARRERPTTTRRATELTPVWGQASAAPQYTVGDVARAQRDDTALSAAAPQGGDA